jgi:polysaccharide pyruvyl transferase CsaB
MASSRIIVSGYYGYHNVGDEAVLSGVLEGLSEAAPRAEVAVAHASPSSFAPPCDGVWAFGRYSPAGWARALRGADLFLSGGGSLIQDATSLRSLLYYLSGLMVARGRGIRTIVYAQGIGPLRRAVARALARAALTRVDRVVLRDSASYDLARRMGASEGRMTLAADQALLLDPPQRTPEDIIAVVIRKWPGLGRAIEPLAAALDMAPLPVLLIPFQPPDSEAIAKLRGRMRSVTRVAPLMSWREAWELIAGARAVLSMRLHGLIFAAASGVPACGLGYDPKVAAFAGEAGIAAMVDLADATEGRISAGIAAALDAARGPRESVAHLVERARLAPRIAAELLEANRAGEQLGAYGSPNR